MSMQGYSAPMIAANKKASGRRLGVKLGRKCISHGIPVIEVALYFNVSRQTIYNWFTGVNDPNEYLTEAIEQYTYNLTSTK